MKIRPFIATGIAALSGLVAGASFNPAVIWPKHQTMGKLLADYKKCMDTAVGADTLQGLVVAYRGQGSAMRVLMGHEVNPQKSVNREELNQRANACRQQVFGKETQLKL